MAHDVTFFAVPQEWGWKRFVQDDKDRLIFQLESESESVWHDEER